jgi:hypothetical protein
LENLDDDVHINRAWKTVRENIKISAKWILGYYQLKQHKPWFDRRYSELLDQRKRAKLQWLQDLSKINGDNLNNMRLRLVGISRIKRGSIRKTKLMSLQQTVRTRTLET